MLYGATNLSTMSSSTVCWCNLERKTMRTLWLLLGRVLIVCATGRPVLWWASTGGVSPVLIQWVLRVVACGGRMWVFVVVVFYPSAAMTATGRPVLRNRCLSWTSDIVSGGVRSNCRRGRGIAVFASGRPVPYL